MNQFDGPTFSGGSEPTREELESKVLRLEQENAKLRAEAEQWEHDRFALEWYRFEGLPKSEAEFLARKGPTISEVIAECERELANGNI